MDLFATCEFDEIYRAEYQKGDGHCLPTNPVNRFDETTTSAATKLATQVAPTPSALQPKVLTPEEQEKHLQVFGHHISDFINTLYPNGAPVNTRHRSALKLASDLMILLDGDEALVAATLKNISWVQDVIKERGEKEIDDIIDSAKKQLKKRESENLYELRPSRDMQRAIEQLVHQKYSKLVAEARAKQLGGNVPVADDVTLMLERMGRKLQPFIKHYPLLRLLCYKLKPKHYIAAMFVGGAFAMVLMTRCWYRFWAEPSRRCRLNGIIELIGRSGSGKHMAVDIYEIMMEPIKKADAPQIEALNRWNAENAQKNGSSKNKNPRPTGIMRSMPAETSAAGIREAEYNAKETIDGEVWPLHICQFNCELDDKLRQQKKDYMNTETLFLKSLHNEPAGSFYKTSNSPVGEYNVHFIGVYTGTEDALAKQNTTSNFARGYLQRLSVIPMGDSNFEMREKREYTEADAQHDQELREWAYRLDACKGEIPFKAISDALYLWTERRMNDAREDASKAVEDLVKRPCWIAANTVLPFIVSRHWASMVEDGNRYKCGPEFKIDKTDVNLALFIASAQFEFQRHFFLSTGEKLYEEREICQTSNTRHQQKTVMAFRRLPELFTYDDVMRVYGYDSKGSVCSRLKRLQDDGLAQKIRSGEHKGKYRKLA